MKFIHQLKESLAELWGSIAQVLPKILVALVAIVVALLFIKLIIAIVRRALRLVKADRLDDKLNQIELIEGKQLNFSVIDIVSKSLKWILYIILVFILTDILELTMVADGLKNLLGYLPKLFTALAIFVLGLLFANFIKKSLQSFFESMDLSGSKIISQMVFIVLLVFVSITALNQAGIDTTIITSNVTLIFGALLAAFTLAFGLGSRAIIHDLLLMFYTRRKYEIGQRIKFLDKEGVIESVDDLSVTLKTKNGTLIVPIKDITENQVEIQD